MAEIFKSGPRRPLHVAVMRSQLGRAKGLGSAKSGVAQWWAERITAIALVPLSLWFIINLIGLLGASHQDVMNWIATPVTIVLLLCLIVATFHHMQLGLQVVIEDYVHDEAARFAAVLLMKAVATLLGLAAVISVLKVGL
jgi:succinate dehydrogenase / fumarate reductase, membrane anchor subunit